MRIIIICQHHETRGGGGGGRADGAGEENVRNLCTGIIQKLYQVLQTDT